MKPVIIALSVLVLSALAEAPSPNAQADENRVVWIGPDGKILPFRTDDEVLEFLRTASIVSDEPIDQGINLSRKVLLEKDGVRAHAIFRTVNKHLTGDRPDRRLRAEFRDSCKLECAAYELDRLLGIQRVPPVVMRRYHGKEGSLQIWVENAIDEETRRRQGLQPPDAARWAHDQALRLVFDTLIYNRDRNLGNMLIDPSWNVWLIDHTRAFPPERALADPQLIVRCDPRLWDQLRNVDQELVRQRLGPYLDSSELRALLIRWNRLVALVQDRIDEHGEQVVLVGRRPSPADDDQ